MSYQVLSRKWRPQDFEDVVGQTHVTQTLQNAIKLNRIGHGYIFTGPRGVGKTTVARILSKAINCKTPKDLNPCNTCTICSEITDGSSLDVLELDGASNRGIDEIRELRESVKYPPNSCNYRVYIIDEVHMLTKEAFNALLKTLEEPPGHVVFLLATTDPHKVPQTILSRTQRFDFKRLSLTLISDHLKNILQKENIEFEDEAITLIARKADGSMRDSLSLLDQVIAYSGSKIKSDRVMSSLGIIKDEFYINILEDIFRKDINSILSKIESVLDGGHSIPDFISGFNELLRDVLVLKSGATREFTFNVNLDNYQVSHMDLLRILELSMNFETRLRYIQQPRIALETLMIKLASMESCIEVRNIITGNTTIEKSNEKTTPLVEKKREITTSSTKLKAEVKQPIIEKKEIPPTQNKVSEPTIVEEKTTELNSSITFEVIQEKWSEVLEKLEESNGKIANFLEDVILLGYDETTSTLQLEHNQEFHIKTLKKDNGIIESIINEVFGLKISIVYKLIEKSRDEAISSTKKNEGDKEHPLFMEVLEAIEGEVLR